ncbi:tetratricopeptide repeat protein [Streptomyces sp. V4-01]|uniref:Tetratricopeptide repeat protein n=1 Tax=Actinacidiphila polyblastidii TaxID=3110430 RepID=A0ABU7PCQ3_9ACTN|nr:tetratricopeptide repeat protein [Streptomyces sp. V4-01]
MIVFDRREPGLSMFVGRSDEQGRFLQVLADVIGRRKRGPDEGFVLLVQGYGGIGKTTLLNRFAELAGGDGHAVREGKFLVAKVDWEEDRSRHSRDYVSFEGPPVWQVLERIRKALEDATVPDQRANWLDAVAARRRSKQVGLAFEKFRRQITRMKELEEEAARLGIGNVLGHRRMSPEQLAGIVTRVSKLAGLAGAPGTITTPISRAAEAGAGIMDAVRQNRADQIDISDYQVLVGGVDAVVTAFAKALRTINRKFPVVVVLDTCELLGGSGPWLREISRLCGQQTIWVLGMRLDPDLLPAGDTESAAYRRDLNDNRLRLIGLTRFDDRTVADYLTQHLGQDALPRLDITRIIALTHGIPLAVSLLTPLLADRLRKNQPLDDLYPDVDSSGRVSRIVSDMATRYLVHASRPDSDLHHDLRLLISLALLHHTETSPWPDNPNDGNGGLSVSISAFGDVPRQSGADGTDQTLLAALWGCSATEVAEILPGLAKRHDFVDGRTGRIHGDVTRAIRLHQLASMDRHTTTHTAMNQRATDHLRQRLAAMPYSTIEEQFRDPDWRATAVGLLWHTYWASPVQGARLLRRLYPVAYIRQPKFARLLVETSSRFAPYCPAPDRNLINQLTAAAADSRPWHDGRAVRAVVSALVSDDSMPEDPVLAGPTEPYLSLFGAVYANHSEVDLPQQVAALQHVAADFPPDSGPPAERIGEAVYRLWRSTAPSREATDQSYHSEGATPLPDMQGTRLAILRLGAQYRPDDAYIRTDLGTALFGVGQLAEAEDVFRDALSLDPGNATAHSHLASLLHDLGRHVEAEDTYRHVIGLDSRNATAHNNLGFLLHHLGRHAEAAELYRDALHLDPDMSSAHSNLGAVLYFLGCYAEAEDAYRDALRLDPGNATAHHCFGNVLRNMGRFAEAERAYRQALRFDSDSAATHWQLGMLRLFDGDREEARAQLSRASHLCDGALPGVQLLLCALDRTDPALSTEVLHTAQSVLDAVDKPPPARTRLPPFQTAEARALALAILGEVEAAIQTLRTAMSVRRPADRFNRPLYDLVTRDEPLPGVERLLNIWREIIANDPSAAGPWGGPETP